MDVFKGRRVLLGVTGGISAFKAVELLRLLTKAAAVVDVVMTEHATRFVGEATMRGLSGRPVLLDLYDLPADLDEASAVMPHLGIAENADLALVVPATANTLAKMAAGLADNALVTTLLSVRAPLIVAPGMDHDMWHHPATQDNVRKLMQRGVYFIGPDTGPLARGNVGSGRLAEPEDIFRFAGKILSERMQSGHMQSGHLQSGHPQLEQIQANALQGKRVLVTAGGTKEPIDPVRYIGNRSSGKMGFAVAQAALEAGAQVTLVAASTDLTPPAGCEVVPADTAVEMHRAVMALAHEHDVIIMSAAVADYRAEETRAHKIKKGEDDQDGRLTLTLVKNPDIAADVGAMRRDNQVLVIFAAETDNLIQEARRKLRTKNAHMVVANDVTRPGSGFGVDTNEVTFVYASGEEESLPLMAKSDVARALIARVARLLGGLSQEIEA